MSTNLCNIENDIKLKLKKLKNGTDIRGIAIETKEHKESLTPEIISLIGRGFSKWLKNITTSRTNLKVAIGMDSRLSGPNLKDSLIEALTTDGINIYDCGISTTPSMFMTTVLEDYKCDGAIMITASHLPYYYNGLKFFTPVGGCEKEDIDEILNLANTQEKSSLEFEKGEVKKVNLIEDYSKILVYKVRNSVNTEKPLEGSKIIVDAGNGAGGFFAYKVLKELGADTEGSQYLEPDGTFPNHIPNPENKEAMESIKNAVLNSKADLGIIFDTDVDRAAIVSKTGEQINKNSLIALMSSIVLKENQGATIVTDSITSTGLGEFITNLGGVHHRFKRGYKNVINEAKKLNEEGISSPLAIETSGHAALRENYFLDDGAYLIVKILIEMSKLKKDHKDIAYLIKNLNHPLESEEKRIKIKCDDFNTYGGSVIEDLRGYVSNIKGWSIEPKNYEGIKINCDKEKGWFLLRVSLHEPLLVLNIESHVKDGVKNIFSHIEIFINNYNKLVL
ncbi:phosphomannomutase/phosphoglucomutase [Clostridium sp. Marseille-Q2269]|uniref:phosphomannomutase/phosphoglucomutase n=1 Tax=Clostridium sp. Marseille-Q2269 TaxID=2942205 RepID=UPI002072C7D8|nr:phosphomannomutase/phosphoglucomutase [Clostridium sp. Marseille-Q2269]